MTQEVVIDTIIVAPFPQYINGEEYVAYIILAKLKDEDGNATPRYVHIGQVGPDTGGQVSWVNDGELTLYEGFFSDDVTSLSDYIDQIVERYRMDSGGGFHTPPNVGEG